MNFRLETRSRIQFGRVTRRMLYLEKRSLPDEKLSGRRMYEERMIVNQRNDHARDMSRENNKRRSFESRGMLFRNRESGSVDVKTDFQEINLPANRNLSARERISASRLDLENSAYNSVIGFFQLWCVKIKENIVSIVLSIVFLLDFFSELIRVRI